MAARPVKNEARSSTLGISFKADLVISHLGEKLILAFRKQLKLGHSGQIARQLYEGLGERRRVRVPQDPYGHECGAGRDRPNGTDQRL